MKGANNYVTVSGQAVDIGNLGAEERKLLARLRRRARMPIGTTSTITGCGKWRPFTTRDVFRGLSLDKAPYTGLRRIWRAGWVSRPEWFEPLTIALSSRR